MIYVIEAVLPVTEIYMSKLIQTAVPKIYNASSVRVRAGGLRSMNFACSDTALSAPFRDVVGEVTPPSGGRTRCNVCIELQIELGDHRHCMLIPFGESSDCRLEVEWNGAMCFNGLLLRQTVPFLRYMQELQSVEDSNGRHQVPGSAGSEAPGMMHERDRRYGLWSRN